MHFPDVLPLSIFLAGGFCLLILFMVVSVMYRLLHPPRLSAGVAAARGWWIDPSDAGLEYDEWTLRLEKVGEVPVWEINHPSDPDGPVLIMTHDWSESKIAALQRVPAILPYLSRIVLWDLPGHGDTEASTSCLLGSREKRYLDELVRRSSEKRPTILYGWGMGAGISTCVASRNVQVIGTIIERPSRNYIHQVNLVLGEFGIPFIPVGMIVQLVLWIIFPGLRNQDILDCTNRLSRPILVLPGAEENQPVAQTARMVAEAAASGEYAELETGDIQGRLSEGERRLERRIRDFIQACVARWTQETGSAGMRGSGGSSTFSASTAL